MAGGAVEQARKREARGPCGAAGFVWWWLRLPFRHAAPLIRYQVAGSVAREPSKRATSDKRIAEKSPVVAPQWSQGPPTEIVSTSALAGAQRAHSMK